MNSNFQLPVDDSYNQALQNRKDPSAAIALDESLKNQSIAARTDRSGGMVEPSELELELFNRLLKTGVIRASPAIKTIHERKIVVLDQQNSQRYLTGHIFGQYLIVLKEVMAKLNQDFAIDPNLATQLKEQVTPQARLYNWNMLCNELDVSIAQAPIPDSGFSTFWLFQQNHLSLTSELIDLFCLFSIENWYYHRERYQEPVRRRRLGRDRPPVPPNREVHEANFGRRRRPGLQGLPEG